MSSDSSESGGSTAPKNINVNELKPGMENVTVRVRVLSVTPPRTIETKKGSRTISNAVVGDSTGRVEAVMWGEKTTSLKEGEVVEIKGAWITEYRGKVQLNIGKNTDVTQLPSDSVPEEIPETQPRATGGGARSFGRPGRRSFPRRRRGESYE
ncbi:MAG: OB-fold nucleic acid binding domain-containing protein [Desulfurococcaceae archaeon]|jgi:replication factor A1